MFEMQRVRMGFQPHWLWLVGERERGGEINGWIWINWVFGMQKRISHKFGWSAFRFLLPILFYSSRMGGMMANIILAFIGGMIGGYIVKFIMKWLDKHMDWGGDER